MWIKRHSRSHHTLTRRYATLCVRKLAYLYTWALFLNSSETWYIPRSTCCGRIAEASHNNKFIWFWLWDRLMSNQWSLISIRRQRLTERHSCAFCSDIFFLCLSSYNGILTDRFIANFLGNVSVKEFRKSVNIWWRQQESRAVARKPGDAALFFWV